MEKREIKFRGLSINTNTWFYGYYYFDGEHHVIVDESGNHIKVKEESVTQYTGLKDKNGKEIYEGDIIRHQTSEVCLIIFENGGFCMKYEDTVIKRIASYTMNYAEVIGNN